MEGHALLPREPPLGSPWTAQGPGELASSSSSSSTSHCERQKIINMLDTETDKKLPNWMGHRFQHCEDGVSSDLRVEKRTGLYKHRYSSRRCRNVMSSRHLHLAFTESGVFCFIKFEMPACLLALKLLRLPQLYMRFPWQVYPPAATVRSPWPGVSIPPTFTKFVSLE